MGYETINVMKLTEAANWQVTASEKSYLTVRQLLRDFAARMQQALLAEERRYRSSIDQEDKQYEQRLEQLKKQHEDLPNEKAKNAYDALAAEVRERISREKVTLDETLDALAIRFRKETALDKIGSFIVSKTDAAQLARFDERRSYLKTIDRTLTEAYDQVLREGQKLRDASFRRNRRVYEQYAQDESKKHQLAKENIENEHRNMVQQLVNAYTKEFSRYFTTSTFSTAYGLADTTMRSAIGYSCSDKVPESLYFGTRTFRIPSGRDRFSPEVVNLFRRIDHPAVTATSREISVSLPFFRSIEEGYSVYLQVRDAAAPANNRIVWDYVMKTLMNFPAGQTRPLLLDCDSTTELTDFKVIGDSSGRNLVTKTWVDPKEIESELKKLAVDNANLTGTYGKDIASRMLREPIYVVACRNFPKDISPEAMSSMTNIISAGSSRGFFGILQASVSELANKAAVPGFSTQLDTIKKASLCVEETETGYIIADSTGKDLFEFEPLTAAEANRKEIFSFLIDGVSRYRRQVEKFEYLFSRDAGNITKMDMHNINTWFRGDASTRMEVPIGISGASTVQKYTIGGIAHHGLISGVTGSGKSTLLKTLIVASMMKYTPDNLNLYLIDFKEGVEFSIFSEYTLPWIKAIALNTHRIFALNILKDLEREFKRRAERMNRNSARHISDAEEKFPRVLLIFDEVQELLRINDEITQECINILASLVSEGRAMNINVIMASQNFAVCQGMNALEANMDIRIALKGSPESAKIVMGSDFDVGQLEMGDAGAAAISTASGTSSRTTFFQVGFLEDEEMRDILSKLAMVMSTRKADTRIMSVHASQDRNSKFNRLITDGEVDYAEKPDQYELMLGDEFLLNKKREIFLSAREGENLMLVGSDEATAKSVFALSILSGLYGDLACRAKSIDNELVRLVDMSDEYGEEAEYLQFLASQFGRQVNRVSGEDVRSMIDDTYRVLMDRKKGLSDKSERLFLMIFGLDSIHVLRKEMFGDEDELPLNTKLLRLIQEGPKNGINCILWARSYEGFQEVVDSIVMNRHFNKRIYFGDSECAKNVLGIKHDMGEISDMTVAYRDISKAAPNNFRVFNLPNPYWVRSFADAYRNFRHEQ